MVSRNPKLFIVAGALIAMVFLATAPPQQPVVDLIAEALQKTGDGVTPEVARAKALEVAPKTMAMVGITLLALVLWSTEAIPIPLTGLSIILLVAVSGVLPLATAFSYVASEVNILVLAGLIISVALSKHSLDRYLSLRLLYVVGNRSDRIVLGMMLSTALVSMWIPNTAAAAIMAPVGAGILSLLGLGRGRSNFAKALMIGIAYGASIGGIGTPVGTPPVPITIDNVRRATGVDIGFASWIAWGVPLSLLLVLIAWLLLVNLYRPEFAVVADSRGAIERELSSIGGLSGSRKKTLALFIAAVALWLAEPVMGRFVSGWTYVASAIIVIIFTLPGLGALSWSEAMREVDWGTLFLVAGGLALGSGLRAAKVTDVLSTVLSGYLRGANPTAMIAVVGLASGLAITVFSSITATSSAMVPVAIALAKALGIHPAVAGVVAGISSCFAFLLPANTPPNAIAYSYGYFRAADMLRAGIILMVLSVAASIPFAVLVVPSVVGVPVSSGN